MPRRRRDLEVFSLSFLDCISCAFGALILLFVISMGSERISLQSIRDLLLQLIEQRAAELASVLAEREAGERRVAEANAANAAGAEALRRLEVEDATLVRRLEEAERGAERLAADVEEKREELDARQRLLDIPQSDQRSPVGLPVDATHVVFVLDTSGSMRDPLLGVIYPYVVARLREVLTAYPRVQGIQFLDADGAFLVPGSAGRWLTDNRAQRDQLLQAVATYPRASESNPVPGLTRALRSYAASDVPGQKVAIFVLGDEFTQTAAEVLPRLDRLNPRGPDGSRRATINAIGFPHVVMADRRLTRTGTRFANLMRELAWAHDGAFVGVID